MTPLARLLRALAALALAVGCGPSLPPSAPHALIGRDVSLTLVSNDGRVVSLPLEPSATVVDYFAPTCVPCRKKVPELVAARARLEAAGARLVLVGVLSEEETTELAERTLREWGVPEQPFLVDREDVSARQAGVNALPMTQIFDGAGILRWVAPTSATPDEVVRAVSSL